MSDIIFKKVKAIINDTDKKISKLELGKDAELQADVIKTLKAVAYEKIKSIMKGGK